MARTMLSIVRKGRRISPGNQSVSSCEAELIWGKGGRSYLVSRNGPAALGYQLRRLLVDRGFRRGNFVLYAHACRSASTSLPRFFTPSTIPVSAAQHTTVSSSNGLAVSMFVSVASRSFSSRSTFSLVASAFLTASTSKASMALSWRETSYLEGWKALKRFSISSTTAWFLRMDR